jgi:UDP-N-acetylmuramoyl-tripeptide--D-alanyl-D-alanine ligase
VTAQASAALSLDQVLASTGGRLIAQGNAMHFTGVSTDTRTIPPGALFVALKGERFDGHDFVAQAFHKGAAGAVVSRPVETGLAGCVIQVPDTLVALGGIAKNHRSNYTLPVVAVTGSVGKTTTKDMVAGILSQRGQVLKTQENYNNEIGVPLTALELNASHSAAVFELAMRGPGEIAYLTRIVQPTIGVITNIGVTHLERLGTLEAIAAAKAELLQEMGPESVSVLNADEGISRSLQRSAKGGVVTFGFGEGADVRAVEVSGDAAAGLSFRLVTQKGDSNIALSLPGRHQVLNALAATAAALEAGANLDDVRAGLREVTPGKHRMHVVEARRGFKVLDDCYNASPASMLAAFDVLADMPAKRRMAVLGEMKELGPRAPEFHREVGKAAAEKGVSFIVAVGDLAEFLREGAVGIIGEQSALVASSLREAADLILGQAQQGDAVLVKGSRAVGLEEVVERLISA